MNPLRKKAKEVAEALLMAIDFQSPPVQLEKVIGWLEQNTPFKIGVHHSAGFLAENGLSGKIIRENDQVWIMLNDQDSPARKRFTLGHELGHLVSAIEKAGMPSYKPSHASEERFADIFSSELNMPHDSVIQEWEKIRGSYTQPVIQYKLAKTFQVSNAAMGFRLEELGLQTGNWSGQSIPPVYTR